MFTQHFPSGSAEEAAGSAFPRPPPLPISYPSPLGHDPASLSAYPPHYGAGSFYGQPTYPSAYYPHHYAFAPPPPTPSAPQGQPPNGVGAGFGRPDASWCGVATSSPFAYPSPLGQQSSPTASATDAFAGLALPTSSPQQPLPSAGELAPLTAIPTSASAADLLRSVTSAASVPQHHRPVFVPSGVPCALKDEKAAAAAPQTSVANGNRAPPPPNVFLNGACGGISARSALPPPPISSADTFAWMRQNARPLPPSNGRVGAGTNNVRVRTRDKYRMVYSDLQRLELEKEFYSHNYITTARKAELAEALQLTERQIKIWFQNRRAKERKTTKKRTSADGTLQDMTHCPAGSQSEAEDSSPELRADLRQGPSHWPTPLPHH